MYHVKSKVILKNEVIDELDYEWYSGSSFCRALVSYVWAKGHGHHSVTLEHTRAAK
jgi:hypothetical protein